MKKLVFLLGLVSFMAIISSCGDTYPIVVVNYNSSQPIYGQCSYNPLWSGYYRRPAYRFVWRQPVLVSPYYY